MLGAKNSRDGRIVVTAKQVSAPFGLYAEAGAGDLAGAAGSLTANDGPIPAISRANATGAKRRRICLT